MKAGGLLEEIKSHVDIVEFISDYVALKKSGQNYKGLCPFHSEKTPSFMVSQTKQIFHCFGCAAGGDVVSFLMKHDNLPFGEALHYLAKKSGLKITDSAFDKNFSAKRQKILQVNEEAMKFYMRALRQSNTAMAYLKQRGISEDALTAFSIGYAPDQRNTLSLHLKKMGHSDSILMNAGLAVADGKGCRDWFRGRILFPICNMRNDIVAFGGRVMDNALPKYINSPETEIFKKSETLYAINLSKDEIRKKGYALIVEGYLDAIMCHQHGFKNTVAPLGTALTSRHVHKLKSLTNMVVLVFDSDDAGVSAARRSLSILCETDIRAKVLLLPPGEDPDSFLRKTGSEPFSKSLSSAQSMIEFLLSSAKGERIEVVREALVMIASMKDLLQADELVRELVDRSKINEAVLRSELEKMRQKAHAHKREKPQHAAAPFNREELLLLSALLSFPEKSHSVLSQLTLEDIRDETIRSLLRKINKHGDTVTIPLLLNDADDAERTLITGLSLNPGFDPEHVDKNIDDCLLKLKQRKAEKERQLAEDTGDITRLDSLLKEKRKSIKGAHP
ncbi:MAG TPA: DNA primase [Thermodesulfovibrionales bacterium]|jgi:DNA primase|nr:DNA primase [Thermodesulfovibrionales bacterium]